MYSVCKSAGEICSLNVKLILHVPALTIGSLTLGNC